MSKIFWDKGHGGNDPGAVANCLLEKVLTHKIVEYAMAYLDLHFTDFEQRTSRTDDQTVELDKRDDLADNWGADVFVSVHINAGKGKGFESFVHPNAGASTIAFQNVIHAEILSTMRKFDPSLMDRGNKKANYAVVRETKCPAVLTENLFIDSTDNKWLKNEDFIKAVGEAHARGVAKYLGLKEKEKEAPKPPNGKKTIHKVQVGAFADIKNAEKLAAELKKKGYPAVVT
ncbi:N-acetylmuramoyl-L-alanine amidase [Peribacillus alkalitolerans]|uniref:N-acetylmuramoyl-L-alanine amidase n=1 Tax=Peribacillus alkalitolerans TaxID=1550385 RepID=UPI0013D3AD13|nr:N-acetylmuramoyl-L-alanine amidase [Peribacillus alkalitolerans]